MDLVPRLKFEMRITSVSCSEYGKWGSGSQIRLSKEPEALLFYCAPVLPRTPLMLPCAPSVLPLKRLCSVSRPEIGIPFPKFGAYNIYILPSPNLGF